MVWCERNWLLSGLLVVRNDQNTSKGGVDGAEERGCRGMEWVRRAVDVALVIMGKKGLVRLYKDAGKGERDEGIMNFTQDN